MNNKNKSYITLTNPETSESIVLSPSLGGTITSLCLGSDLHQIMENDTENELQKNPLFRGRFLFPFNDRIPKGKYTFNGKDFQLPINCNEDSSAIHGFMYNREVSILKHTASEAVFYWRTGKNTIQGYPFDISLQTEIELHNGGVKISFTVINEGEISAPYALGWHPYFKSDPSSILTADYPFYYDINAKFLPVGKGIPATGSKFDFSNGAGFSKKSLDHTFGAPLNGKSVLKNKNYSIQIKQTNFAYTQLFIPPDKKSIAIEPISSKPNSFNSEEILVLEEGEEYCASIRIDLF